MKLPYELIHITLGGSFYPSPLPSCHDLTRFRSTNFDPTTNSFSFTWMLCMILSPWAVELACIRILARVPSTPRKFPMGADRLFSVNVTIVDALKAPSTLRIVILGGALSCSQPTPCPEVDTGHAVPSPCMYRAGTIARALSFPSSLVPTLLCSLVEMCLC
ncbi:hypothetical protein SCP_1900550 [Sparassis crispa]|uniref:Uncharacterized protein n=1 Tax=Sparassis crispa TaxID=139825 RepID=A0A401H6Z3_9APHY|nr:hypothetical protein SCP_1900550 [Sparassis crispa]GBE90206.1 hypothetical protein SCP_1900550 [Sparassis crispa]